MACLQCSPGPVTYSQIRAPHISKRKVLLTNELSKPDPACYSMGLKRIGMARDDEHTNVLVLEDSPAGIKAGKAAGCKVLGLVTR